MATVTLGSLKRGGTLVYNAVAKKIIAIVSFFMYFADLATDIAFIGTVWGHTYSGYVLLLVFLFQNVIPGLIFKSRWEDVHNDGPPTSPCCIACYLPNVFCGVILMDVGAIQNDCPGNADKHAEIRKEYCINFDKYQLFRAVGRCFFGILATIVLQSIAFNQGASYENGYALTETVFLLAFLSSAFQWLKATATCMYDAMEEEKSVFTVIKESFMAENVLISPEQVKPQGSAFQISATTLNPPGQDIATRV